MKNIVAMALTILAVWSCVPVEEESGSGGDGVGGTATGAGGGAGTGSGEGGGGGAATCNDLVNDAPEVEIARVAESLPSPAGGRIADGRYHLTAVRIYTGPGGESGPTGSRQKETAVYAESTVQVVVDLFQGDGEQHLTLTVTADGLGPIDYTGVCPGPLNFPFDGYTFTAPSSLMLYDTSADLELVYTRVADS